MYCWLVKARVAPLGLEPRSPRSERGVLPIRRQGNESQEHQERGPGKRLAESLASRSSCTKSHPWDSNPKPQPSQGRVHPIELRRVVLHLPRATSYTRYTDEAMRQKIRSAVGTYKFQI